MNRLQLAVKRTVRRVVSSSVGRTFALLLAFLSFGAAGLPAYPSADKVTDEPGLIGTWRFLTQAEDYYYTLDLRADGRFAIYCRLTTGTVIQMSGRWSCHNQEFTYVYEKSTHAYTKSNDPKKHDTLVSVNATTLIVDERGEGGRKVYRRLNNKSD